ncbi:hypothetical protein BT69DRAFT_1090596 [Atractiella rhizophila]|nr:hypothetical protein BT69DRAFT_1090596 [Atractiella rhizophila]
MPPSGTLRERSKGKMTPEVLARENLHPPSPQRKHTQKDHLCFLLIPPPQSTPSPVPPSHPLLRRRRQFALSDQFLRDLLHECLLSWRLGRVQTRGLNVKKLIAIVTLEVGADVNALSQIGLLESSGGGSALDDLGLFEESLEEWKRQIGRISRSCGAFGVLNMLDRGCDDGFWRADVKREAAFVNTFGGEGNRCGEGEGEEQGDEED